MGDKQDAAGTPQGAGRSPRATDAASLVLAGQEAIESWQEDVYSDLHRHPELSGHARTPSA